jgi:hypothetical protein
MIPVGIYRKKFLELRGLSSQQDGNVDFAELCHSLRHHGVAGA